MSALDRVHARFVHRSRSVVIAEMVADALPEKGRVLDVGCGDGLIAALIKGMKPQLDIQGIDVLVRPQTRIPVAPFDGMTIPHPAESFDGVVLVDVLHHAEDPFALLCEAARVSRNVVVIKDHTLEGLLAGPTLRFMDHVGNDRHGVEVRADYWREQKWLDAFRKAGLTIEAWTGRVPLYPWWASWLFGRSLHFVATLRRSGGTAEAEP